MVQRQQPTPGSSAKNRVHTSITLAVVVSLALILTGIWNGYETGQVAEENIRASLELQRLSDSLRLHQESMGNAINLAVSSGETHWSHNYELSLFKLRNAIKETDRSFSLPLIKKIQTKQESLILLERELFQLLAQGKQDAAFLLLASENYQNMKIEQEQDALTLRATLDKKSKGIITTLKSRLNRTMMALVLQIGLIVAIWIYIITLMRRWQQHQRKHNAELARLAHYDSLTGIGNRALFQLRLEAAFQQSRRDGKPVGLILMDIDHFKDVNDNLGHDTGDRLLIKTAKELQQACRESDTVVRLGGDEFAIIATNIDKKSDGAILANKILDIFNQPLKIQGGEIKTGTSIGLAFFPDDADSSDELLRKADMALYEAKRNGRGNFKFFDSEIEVAARNKAKIQSDLELALEQEQFSLHYQPIIDIAENHVVGVECMLRWQHPEHGDIPPNDFIQIAEESRLIVPIGEWVLRTACQQQVQWQNLGLPPLTVAINLSAVQFKEHDLLSKVERVMHETAIKKDQLIIEITESTLMETEGNLIDKLHSLRSLGIKLAIDDFGTGYSSLAYLKRFPIQHLKIDREFIKDLPDDTHDIAIARSIIKMAHELQIDVVAEGIENKAQLDFLKNAHCNFAQGYHFGRPMPATTFERWLQCHHDKHDGKLRAIS